MAQHPIDEHLLDNVAFLVMEEERDGAVERVPKATAFFVIVAHDDMGVLYFVTARHCIEETEGREFYVRATTTEGFRDVPTRAEEWWTHDAADVAVSIFAPTNGGPKYVMTALGPDEFVTDQYDWLPADLPFAARAEDVEPPTPTTTMRVEVGHAVFFVGLFVQHAGSEKNLPVARFGNVARMPTEPIAVEGLGGSSVRIPGYLVECKSWGGHSGSPVYWRAPVLALHDVTSENWPGIPEGERHVIATERERAPLLGLVSAHFDIAQRAKTTGDIVGSIETAINSGIAIVTPSWAIRELLFREDVVKDRDDRVNEQRRRGGSPAEGGAQVQGTDA